LAALVAMVVTAACSIGSGTARSSPSASSTSARPSAGAPATGRSPRPSVAASPLPSRPPSPASLPSPTTAASVPPASFSCGAAVQAGHQLALVTLRNANGVVVRDITDLAHPASICTFSGGQYFQFRSRTEVSYEVFSSGDLGAAGSLYVADLQTGATSLVRTWASGGYGSWLYAWSPDGGSLSYLSSAPGGDVEWHLETGAGDLMLNRLGPVPARGRDPDSEGDMVGFSADGQYLAVVETFTLGKGAPPPPPPFVIVRNPDGRPVSSQPADYSQPNKTLAAWSAAGARLYFRAGSDLLSWDMAAAGPQTAAAGTGWIHPWPSSDGRWFTFMTRDAMGNHHVGLLDVSAGTVRQLSSGSRGAPSFLTPSLIWYQEEQTCTAANPCGMGGSQPTGTTYIYELGSGTESASIITSVFDSWPRVVGQN